MDRPKADRENVRIDGSSGGLEGCARLAEALDGFLDGLLPDRRRSFVPDPHAHYVIACSGGADSVLLAVLYARLHQRGELHTLPSLFHLNHRLRLSAYRDERFVEGLARCLDMPLYVERRRVKEFARRTSRNLEEAGRILRYRWLQRLTASLASPGCQSFAVTAHHAGDFAETVLMKILRGATTNAFLMPDQILLPVGSHALQILRPLLFLDRPEIEEMVHALHIPFRVDPGNASMDYRRNRLRARVVPLLREEGWRPGDAWLRSNGSAKAFAQISGQASGPVSFLRLPLSFVQGATASELKSTVDRALRRMLCGPLQGDANGGVLGDILRQSLKGRLEVHGPDFKVLSSRKSIWILREDSYLLSLPRVQCCGPANPEDGDDAHRPLTTWAVSSADRVGSMQRRFRLADSEEVALFTPGLVTVAGRRMGDLFSDLDVPASLRRGIPLILRHGRVRRVCMSWLGERQDYLCEPDSSPSA